MQAYASGLGHAKRCMRGRDRERCCDWCRGQLLEERSSFELSAELLNLLVKVQVTTHQFNYAENAAGSETVSLRPVLVTKLP